MTKILNLKSVCCVLCFAFLSTSAWAQRIDTARMEMTLKMRHGEKSLSSVLSSYSLSYTKPVLNGYMDTISNQADNYKTCYLVISFDRLDIPLLHLFSQKKVKLDGEILITDRYGKLPTRKVELKGVDMDGMNDQYTGDGSSAFMNLSCRKIIVDGIALGN